MRRVINENESPPGYWWFMVDGKKRGPFPARVQLINDIRDYYRANGKLVPADLESQIDEATCARIDPSLCEDRETHARLLSKVSSNASTVVLQFNAAVQGTMTIGEWFIKGRLMNKAKLVELDKAVERGSVCASCPHNVPVGRCAACVAGRMGNAIKRIVGNASTPIDGQLNACNLCGCSLKAKVWFPLDLLRKHMQPEHLAQFPDFCWLTKESI